MRKFRQAIELKAAIKPFSAYRVYTISNLPKEMKPGSQYRYHKHQNHSKGRKQQ